MTLAAQSIDHIDGMAVTPATVVLQRRTLHPGTDPATMSRFGDHKWDVFAALPHRHTAYGAILWDSFPEPLRHACKLYTFALLNIVDDAPRLPHARTRTPAVTTIRSDLVFLKVFLNWLDERGITSLSEATIKDLNGYANHIIDTPNVGSAWKRRALIAVQRLHAYRHHLPAHCRLPGTRIWAGTSAAELANDPGPGGENRTPRIHPDVMQPLLSAALLVVDTIAADLLPVARRLIDYRLTAHHAAPDIRRQPIRTRPVSRTETMRQHLSCLLEVLAAQQQPLPGIRHGHQTLIDIDGLAIAGWLERSILPKATLSNQLAASNLRIEPDLLRVNDFTPVQGRPWRTQPVAATELLQLLRHVNTACFLVIAYLSGLRTGEVLNLRRGCISRDTKLGLTFLSGQQMKAAPELSLRSPQTIPWVVTQHVAQAIDVLEQLCVGDLLFPAEHICTEEWITTTRCRAPGEVSRSLTAFIPWFNTLAASIDHPVIPPDEHGKITAPRLRRTLAWHIVRRPGGTIAAATQYGHVRTQMTTGYAGNASSGFFDEITFEEFLQRAERLHEDHERLRGGEHVSGPAAEIYQSRVAAAQRFTGLTITSKRQAEKALSNPDLQIHHGELLTCVYRPETAKCRSLQDPDDGPSWPRCQPTCVNIAYTDRDIDHVRGHADGIRADLDQLGLPEPLRHRLAARLRHDQQIISQHGDVEDAQ